MLVASTQALNGATGVLLKAKDVDICVYTCIHGHLLGPTLRCLGLAIWMVVKIMVLFWVP